MLECYPFGRWAKDANSAVNPGDLILTQAGEWEGRSVVAVLRALKTFHPAEQVEEFLRQEREAGLLEDFADSDTNPWWNYEVAGYDYNPLAALVKWLVLHGFVEEVFSVAVLHLPGSDWEN